MSSLAERRHPKTARTRPVNLDARENGCHGSNSVVTFVPFTTVINTNAQPASRHKHPPRPRTFCGRGLVRLTPLSPTGTLEPVDDRHNGATA